MRKPGLKPDSWLAGILECDAFILSDIPSERNFDSDTAEQIAELTHSNPGFIYASVSTPRVKTVRLLEDIGFRLVDTRVVFEREMNTDNKLSGFTEIRFAAAQDEEGVKALAGRSISVSRFHLDPFIPDDIANIIKSEWAGNYFKGQRGDAMIVSSTQGRIAGFLQLIRSGEAIVIDLIAVAPDHRRKRIARDMIAFAQNQWAVELNLIRAGTQIANFPSIRLYQSLLFNLVRSDYMLHFHNKKVN